MAKVNQFTMKIANIQQLKIDVVKFDDMNNFGMWRCKVIDALNAENLKDHIAFVRETSGDFRE